MVQHLPEILLARVIHKVAARAIALPRCRAPLTQRGDHQAEMLHLPAHHVVTMASRHLRRAARVSITAVAVVALLVLLHGLEALQHLPVTQDVMREPHREARDNPVRHLMMTEVVADDACRPPPHSRVTTPPFVLPVVGGTSIRPRGAVAPFPTLQVGAASHLGDTELDQALAGLQVVMATIEFASAVGASIETSSWSRCHLGDPPPLPTALRLVRMVQTCLVAAGTAREGQTERARRLDPARCMSLL